MIPSWVTWDHAKDIVQGIGYVATLYYTHRRTTRRLDRQDNELRKQSQGQEWNNEVTEAVASAILPPPVPHTPSPLPPRPKVATLTDPFEGYVAEAKRLDDERKR